jgi:hypothetical protein
MPEQEFVRKMRSRLKLRQSNLTDAIVWGLLWLRITTK